MLSLFSAVSVRKIEITQKKCINCELCHNACPVDAIRAPYANNVKEERTEGVKRIIGYMLVIPVLMAAGAILMRASSDSLSTANREVRRYEMLTE